MKCLLSGISSDSPGRRAFRLTAADGLSKDAAERSQDAAAFGDISCTSIRKNSRVYCAMVHDPYQHPPPQHGLEHPKPTMNHPRLRTGCCECDDEPSGCIKFGVAEELLAYQY